MFNVRSKLTSCRLISAALMFADVMGRIKSECYHWTIYFNGFMLPITALISSIKTCKVHRAVLTFNFCRAAWNADAVLRCDFCPSVRLSVYPSVRPSVKRVPCDSTEEKSVLL